MVRDLVKAPAISEPCRRAMQRMTNLGHNGTRLDRVGLEALVSRWEGKGNDLRMTHY